MATTQELVGVLTDKLARLTALVGAVLNGAIPVWVSGGNYTAGQLRKSPVNGLFYIANTTHSSVATDPSADAVNWRQFDLDGFAAASHTHTIADITDLDPLDFLPAAGGNVTGRIDLLGTAARLAFRDNSDTTDRGAVFRDDSTGTLAVSVFDNAGENAQFYRFDNASTALGATTSVVRRSDGDARYIRQTGGENLGGLGIGTANVSPGVGNTDLGVYLAATYVAASRSAAAALLLNRITSNGTVAQFYRDGVQEGSISVTTTATSFNTTSDERVKENIVDAGEAGEIIDAVQVRAFDMPHAEGVERYDFGLVAQELYAIFPQAVTPGETDDDLWSVDHSKLVPMMFREIQSLRQRVAALEA